MMKFSNLFIVVTCVLISLSEQMPYEELKSTSELSDIRNEVSILSKLIYGLLKKKSEPSSKNEFSMYGGDHVMEVIYLKVTPYLASGLKDQFSYYKIS